MSRSLFVLTLALVLTLPAALARAEEPTLLERLSQETAAAAKRAKTAVVPVVTGARGGHGVVVGSPPLLVVPYEVAQEFAEILLDDNSGITAERIDGDAQLGVAVYRLPPEQADRWRPLEVENEWTARRGNLALSAGPELRLHVVQEADSVRGALRVDSAARDGVLLSPRGRLLGICVHPQSHYDWTSTLNYVRSSTGPYPEFPHAIGAPWPRNVSVLPESSIYLDFGRTPGGRPNNPYYNDNVQSRDNAFVRTLQPGSYTIYGPWWAAAEPTVVPGPVIARVLRDIEEHGRIRRAYVGIVPGNGLDPEGVTRISLSAVLPESPAKAAGLKAGDLLLSVNGREIADLAVFERVIALLRPGDELRLRLERGNDDVVVVLGERSEARGKLVTPADVGLEVVGLTPELSMWLGLPRQQTGAVIRSVRDGSPAALAGVMKADVIVQAAGHLVRDAAELEAALADASGKIVVQLSRGGATLNFTLTLPAPATPPGAR